MGGSNIAGRGEELGLLGAGQGQIEEKEGPVAGKSPGRGSVGETR